MCSSRLPAFKWAITWVAKWTHLAESRFCLVFCTCTFLFYFLWQCGLFFPCVCQTPRDWLPFPKWRQLRWTSLSHDVWGGALLPFGHLGQLVYTHPNCISSVTGHDLYCILSALVFSGNNKCKFWKVMCNQICKVTPFEVTKDEGEKMWLIKGQN